MKSLIGQLVWLEFTPDRSRPTLAPAVDRTAAPKNGKLMFNNLKRVVRYSRQVREA